MESLPTLSPRRGELQRLGPLSIPGLIGARLVRIYAPRDLERGGPRRVFIVFDGQNVFGDDDSFAGGWHLHDQAEKLSTRARRGPIVVGVDHGGEQRIAELSPWETPRFGPGRLHALLDWIRGALVPALRRALPLEDGPRGVILGGSSLGGLAALYAHHRNPETFGGVLAMSPALWLGGQRIFDAVTSTGVPWTSRIYLDCGALEARGRMAVTAARMAETLRSRGYDEERLLFRIDRLGQHRERDWRRRFLRAARFLMR